MDFLDRIVRRKKEEIERLKMSERAKELEEKASGAPPALDFRKQLLEGVSIIAEIKRRSPSKGVLSAIADPRELAFLYEESGARAVSVLTDGPYFGGSTDDLEAVKERVGIPVLRKDFIFDRIQVLETRSLGADAFLLIVSILEDGKLRDLITLGRELGMSPLVEVHSPGELERALSCGADLIGINNRDLTTFEIDISTSVKMIDLVPAGTVAVAESGITSVEDIELLTGAGFGAFLIGEALVRAEDPAGTIRSFMSAAVNVSSGGTFAG